MKQWGVPFLIAVLLHLALLMWLGPALNAPEPVPAPEPLMVELTPLTPTPPPDEPPPEVAQEPPPPSPPPPPPEASPVQQLEELIQEEPAQKLSMQPLKSATRKMQSGEEDGVAQGPALEETAPASSTEEPLASPPPVPELPPAGKEAPPAARPPTVTARPDAAPVPAPDRPGVPALPQNYLQATPQTDAPVSVEAAIAAVTSNAQPQVSDRPPPPKGNDGPGGGFFTLNRYDWPYESYMGRWARQLKYAWRNNPPLDYVQGQRPLGGDVYVLVRVDRQGRLVSQEVTQRVRSSQEMENSVLDALLATAQLPALPSDFVGEELVVHFRFIYPAYSR